MATGNTLPSISERAVAAVRLAQNGIKAMTTENTLQSIVERAAAAVTLRPAIGQGTDTTAVRLRTGTTCEYCTLFHTEAAKLFGATDEEIQEAVHYAKMTLGWSAYLNGMRQDYDVFAEELQQIGEHLTEQAQQEQDGQPVPQDA